MLGVLRASLIGVKIVEMGITNDNLSKSVQKEFEEWQRNEIYPDPSLIHIAKELRDEDKLKVDLVLTPIDGANSLATGASGSLSVAAAGESGCFAAKSDDVITAYLTIAVPKHSMETDIVDFVSTVENTHGGTPVKDVLENFTELEHIVSLLLKTHGVPPIVAITLEGIFKDHKVSMKTWHRQRILEGSVVANGLAAFLDRVDCSVFITRWPQLIQVAIAARGLGGEIIAIPLKDREVASGSLLRAEDLVLKANAVLCATSISEVCVLDRVRFHPEGSVKTDSITVSLATGRIIRQADTFSLEHANARDRSGIEVKLGHRIKELWQSTETATGSAWRPPESRFYAGEHI
jgi:hypothetical protein